MNEKEIKNFTRLVIPTEVYSRVVGYYRPVQNWNVGKKKEFSLRKSYDNCLKQPMHV